MQIESRLRQLTSGLPTEEGLRELHMLSADAAGELERLRSLALDMGRVIRALDENHEHLELWTQDGEYLLDGRWRA